MSGQGHVHGVSYVDQALSVTAPQNDPALGESWTRIVVPPVIKERLVNHALLAIGLRKRGVANIALPLHGLVLLSGPPGVGKTSLARGLSSELSSILGDQYGQVRLVDVNLHLLPSELLGRTQRNIVQLFQEELPALAELGPIVVVLDEIEVLAVSRSEASLDINPADVFRGTAALLSALDWLAQHVPGVFVVGTTNLPAALDRAFVSRADLVLELPLPTAEVVREILADSLDELAKSIPGSCSIGGQSEGLDEVAELLVGRDGRQVRKFIADALASSRDTALDPALLEVEDLVRLARE